MSWAALLPVAAPDAGGCHLQAWLRFEREHGTLADLAAAEAKTEPIMTQAAAAATERATAEAAEVLLPSGLHSACLTAVPSADAPGLEQAGALHGHPRPDWTSRFGDHSQDIAIGGLSLH